MLVIINKYVELNFELFDHDVINTQYCINIRMKMLEFQVIKLPCYISIFELHQIFRKQVSK